MHAASDIRQRPIGGSLGLFFAGLWSVLGALALQKPMQAPAMAVGLLLSAVLILRLWRLPNRADGGTAMFRRRAYAVAVVLEIAALYGVALLLPRYGLRSYFIPAVGVVVGLHFVGLWKAAGHARFLWIAAGMTALSLLSMAIPAAPLLVAANLRDAVCAYGNAVVLWCFAGQRLTA